MVVVDFVDYVIVVIIFLVAFIVRYRCRCLYIHCLLCNSKKMLRSQEEDGGDRRAGEGAGEDRGNGERLGCHQAG